MHFLYIFLGILMIGVVVLLYFQDWKFENSFNFLINNAAEKTGSNDNSTDKDWPVKTGLKDDVAVLPGDLSYRDDSLGIVITYPFDWKIGTNKDFNYPNYYIYLNSNIEELGVGYDYNTRIEIKEVKGEIGDLADQLEDDYRKRQEMSNVAPGWQDVEWWRGTDEIRSKFSKSVEMVVLVNNAPIEGLPYSNYTYFVKNGEKVIAIELTVVKVKDMYGIDEEQLRQAGERIIYQIQYM